MVTQLDCEGVLYRRKYPYTSKQNVAIESKYKRIPERGLALPFQSKVPFIYWNYDFRATVYLLKFLLFIGTIPNLRSYFGSQCFPCLHFIQKIKWEPCSMEEGVFVPYASK